MPNWNLSVRLTGQGADLNRSLRTAAGHARTLAQNARQARQEIGRLGTGAGTARGHIRSLGQASRTAATSNQNLARSLRDVNRQLRGLRTAGSGGLVTLTGQVTALTGGANALRATIGQTRTHIRRLGSDSQRTAGHVRSLGQASRVSANAVRANTTAVRQNTGDLRSMSRQIQRAVADLTRLAAAARTAGARLNSVGDGGARGMRRFGTATAGARSQLASMASLLAGGGLIMGLRDMIKEGNAAQKELYLFGAVTSGNAVQMARAAEEARQLGQDMKLPTATAAGAAKSMVELAKAGFRTDQAISATRASLNLAAAANVNAADSAKYLGDMMDQFGMGADQASRAADILAATANSASGDIIDIYYSMKYAGPVAHGLGVSMEEAAAGVGMLGKAGILGQTAGTTLRGIFTNLANSTPKMKQGLAALGIEAWTAEGRFKGLRYVIERLSKAQHDMSQKDFTAAAAKAFGKPALSGAIALAHQGLESYDSLIEAVGQSGAAADIAAARNKGLAGAFTLLRKQVKATGLEIYTGLAPGLEWMTRGLTSGLAKATPKIRDTIEYTHDLITLFGPGMAAEAKAGLGDLSNLLDELSGPLKALGFEIVADGLHMLINAARGGKAVLDNLVDGAEPIAEALTDIVSGSSNAAGALDILVTIFDLAASAADVLSSVLIPIGHVVGGLVSGFGALPGPVQTAILMMLLVRRVTPAVTGLAGQVRGGLVGAWRSFGTQMATVQRAAAIQGVALGRMGAAVGVLGRHVPTVNRMAVAFRGAQASATGLTGTMRGVTAAAGTGMRGAMSGLVGFLGGPWGVAMLGATVALGLLASSQAKASAKAQEHRAQMDSLTQALRQSNGIIDENVRQTAAQAIQQKKLKVEAVTLMEIMEQAGFSLADVTDAYLNQGSSIDGLAKKMRDLADAEEKAADSAGNARERGKHLGNEEWYRDAADALGDMSGEAKKAAKDANDLNAATKGTGDGLSAYDRLKTAVGALADRTSDADSRTRALRDALDQLAGGAISVEAAEKRLQETIANIADQMKDFDKPSKAFSKNLVSAAGEIDKTSKTGRTLFEQIESLGTVSADAAIQTFEMSRKTKGVGESLQDAMGAMSPAMDELKKLGEQYGLTGDQVTALADRYGLLPEKVAILLSAQTEGVDSTLAELLAVQAEFKATPDKKEVRVDVLSEEAQEKLKSFGITAELIPGTREYKLTAKTDEAKAKLNAFLRDQLKVQDKGVTISAETQQAITGLQAVQAKLKGTKGKTLTIKAPTAAAIEELRRLGFKVETLPNGKVTISIPTGGNHAALNSLQAAINNLHGTTVTNYVTTVHKDTFYKVPLLKADGGTVDYYADGGVQRGGVRRFAGGAENHVAQIAPAGTWRVWAEPETGGESYIPFALSKRRRSREIAEETVRRLGGKGIAWEADGGIVQVQPYEAGGFSYEPPGMRRSVSDVQSRYSEAHQPISKADRDKAIRARANAVDNLRAAEARLRHVRRHKHTHAQLVAAETRVSKARRSLATATDKARTAESRYRKRFSLGDWQKTLRSAVSANASWEKNLAKIASRGGGSVVGMLRDMGEEGAAMVAALAKASKKQFADIVANLKKLAPEAKATLADYSRQLTAATKLDTAFAKNLATLAARGHGDLAAQLAAQGDEAAQQLAAAAVKDNKKAATAEKAATAANKALTSEQVGELVQIIAAIKTSSTGIHTVAGTTGLGEDVIIDVANRATSQIKSSLGSRAAKFLADLARANKHLSYADGGIRPGMYPARRPYGMVRWAEPETGGEAYIPLGAGKRTAATDVLRDVAGRFGLGLTDVAAARTRVVVVQQGGPLVGSQTWQITTRGSAVEAAREIESRDSYQLRRLARGGVHHP